MATRRNLDGTYEVDGHPGTFATAAEAEAAAGGSASSSASAGGFTPAAPGDYAVTLPQTDEAMGALRGLQLSGTRGLEALLGRDTTAHRKSVEDALYDSQARDINYALDRDQQRGLETLFGRGMGVSSATGDYVLGPIARERADSLANARRKAFTEAGDEVRADTTSQLQMLGQAFNQGTSGLQAEANVGQANAARRAQIDESRAARAQQESQFTRGQSQQKDLTESGFKNAREIADRATTAGAVGAGLGGLAQFFAPAANNFLANQYPTIFGKPK